jgi:phosphohistidine phosphatase SixA
VTRQSFLLCCLMAAVTFLVQPAQVIASDDLLERLREPGTHAIMRHALAPGTGDPAALDLSDCSTQRNLDERGRAQAREIGRALSNAGIVFDQVLTSQWCRCRETAALLGVGDPEDLPALNSFFRDRSKGKGQTEQLKRHIAGLKEGRTVMFVTHYVNILGLTERAVTSGEVLVFRQDDAGEIEVMGTYLLRP